VLGGQQQAHDRGVAVQAAGPDLLQLVDQEQQRAVPRAAEIGEGSGDALFQDLQLTGRRVQNA
jgi:hypothetical protein